MQDNTYVHAHTHLPHFLSFSFTLSHTDLPYFQTNIQFHCNIFLFGLAGDTILLTEILLFSKIEKKKERNSYLFSEGLSPLHTAGLNEVCQNDLLEPSITPCLLPLSLPLFPFYLPLFPLFPYFPSHFPCVHRVKQNLSSWSGEKLNVLTLPSWPASCSA